ncbi:Peptidase S24/S26A/S26B, conserved region [Allomeiothermus silvanus DSM 9946]|uniref:Peptidase S24/S26A/S26B, conserved region n=1 Tax=Allomeiothermus silvanus (strain ATCC 700542 / DSM 9946 / NBRC 106475 / NCIMB 13440 / VI-R2) TaxID=526227 RepID=D7BDT0_ALLS1|nr:Peptidase S24/S26A/S26B, conserved region [Allomeiothermus silvanus DSM 9946]
MVAIIEAAEAIKARLKQLDISQAEFSKRVGKSPGWAGARFLPSVDTMVRYLAYKEPTTLERILDVLQWTPEEFSQETGIQLPGSEITATIPVTRYRIPVVDAGAGPPMWNENAEYITLHIPDLKGKPESELFAVRVGGDSMQPTLKDGDVVVFWTGGAVEPGRIVAVHVHWDGVIVKRLQRYNGSWYLYSDNPDHPPVPLTDNDRVLGVAATLVRKM